MKNRGLIILVVAVILYGCAKSNLSGTKTSPATSKSDTSTTLISNTELVGTWNVITDTVDEYGGTPNTFPGVMYHGTPADHYIFTKYGNVYIKTGFQVKVDTGIYTISGTDSLNWVNYYLDFGGGGTRSITYQKGYIITALAADSLVLTQSGQDGTEFRYE